MATGYQLTPEELKAVAENGSARDKAAAASGQFAQTFNQSIANQGLRSGATQVPQAPAGSAPAKASAAPVAGKENIFTGLCEALNTYQKGLVKLDKREIPDQYVIEFTPPSIGAATVKRPGGQDITTAPMQTPNSATKLDSATQSLNKDARTWSIKAGTQIIKVIDDVMRNSSYITEQQNVEITTVTDPVTGIQTQKTNAKAGTGNMQWYKISVAASPLGYDKIIRDYAYKMTFIITPYAIAQMTSQYFPDSRYRGVHKSYQYWFTGNNTQILHYEQNYNNAYRLLLTGIGADKQKSITTNFRDQNRYIFMATSENQAGGAKNYANEPGDNAASFLYDPLSLSQVKLRIVGDPGWMQQGECGLGVKASTFSFRPFTADGSINFDSQAVMFDVSFNQPTDYNFNTGVMDVNAHNTSNGYPQEHYTFTASTCKSTFSKGRFEQEIVGKLLLEKNTSTAAQGRPTTSTASATNVRPATIPQSQADAQDLENGKNAGTGTRNTGAGVSAVTSVSEIEYDQLGNPINSTGLPPTPQPAAAPAAPTSSGSISGASILNGPPPPPITIAPTTPILNPNATGQTLVAQPGTSTPPQKMNKEY
jgi:hypothetical protein